MTRNAKILLGAVAAYAAYRYFSGGEQAPATVPTGTAPAAPRGDALAPVLQSMLVVGRSFFDPPPVAGGAPVIPIPGFVP
jgi:hypothetical protein